MNKNWIEVTRDGRKELLNIDNVSLIAPTKTGCLIYFTSGFRADNIEIEESYEEVKSYVLNQNKSTNA